MRPGSVLIGLFPPATQVHAFGVPLGRGGLAGDLGPLLGSEAVGARLQAAFDAEDRTVPSSRHGVVGHSASCRSTLVASDSGCAGLVPPASAYAVADRRCAGTRVGLSRAIQQFGSLFALTAGAQIAGQFGPKSAFLFLGLASFLALPFAPALPRERAEPRPSRPRWFPKPRALVLIMTIALLAQVFRRARWIPPRR